MEIPTNHEQGTTPSNREGLRRIFREMDNNQTTPLDGPFKLLKGLSRLLVQLGKCTFVAIILLGLSFIALKFFLLFIIGMQE